MEISQIENICKPVTDFLKANYNPHTTIIITSNSIQVVSDEVYIPINRGED